MTSTPDVRDVVRALRAAIGDFNLWPTSESDSPLIISTRKGEFLTDKSILSLDASLRRKVNAGIEGYKVPTDRQITRDGLHTRVWPVINHAFLQAAKQPIGLDYAIDMERNAETCEFLIQVYNQFAACYGQHIEVTSPGNAMETMIIAGQCQRNGEPYIVMAYTALTQTPGRWL